jgi:hypothetical protein
MFIAPKIEGKTFKISQIAKNAKISCTLSVVYGKMQQLSGILAKNETLLKLLTVKVKL